MIDDKHPAPMAQVKMSDYSITLAGENAEAVYDQVPAFLAREHVMAVKKTKSGEKEIDIRPLAVELRKTDDGLYARLMLTEQNTLKPDLLVRTLADMAGVEAPEMRIHRTMLLGEDGLGEIQPLMAL